MDERILVVFETGDGSFEARLKPYEIIHDGIHHGIPEELRRGKRLVLRSSNGDDVYPDMFAIEVATAYGDRGSVTLATTIQPISGAPGPWKNVGFDHLAIVVADRQAAYDFFTQALQLKPMRHDEHMTVLTTGHTSLFLFDTGDDVPLSDGNPSRWHHLGFVVDNLEHAYFQLTQYAALVSDFTLLERLERWSLYGHYRNGDVTFMIQLSEIREGSRGFEDASFTDYLYDYGAQLYGKRIRE